MPNEQINLSDALDLIMQSKTDIKSSVQNKGSEIGDDLTQYAQSIDNIQFRSLQFKNNDTGDMQTSFDVSRYNDLANVSVQQYINGETSYPVNTSYTVSGTSISVTKNTPGTNKQVYRCVPTNYGTTILTIEDTVGNVEYPIALHVPAITIYGDYNNTMSGFDSFEWDENIPVAGWNAAWDTSVQQNPNFTATFSFNDGNGHNVDAANLSFDITGDVIDAGLATVTYVTASNTATFTFTPHYNNDDSQYEYYNGEINIAISDGTSTGDIAPIYLTGGSDIPDEPTGPYFSSPADGDSITGSIDPSTSQFTYPVKVVGADGNNISYDITSTNIYPETGGSLWNISYDEDEDGNGGTYISRVYMACYSAGTGEETLTFTDPNTGATCSTTFTYDISEGDSSDDSSEGDEPTQPSFTYDVSDENSPIQVNVDLTNYPGSEIVEGSGPEVNINFSAPQSNYNWNNMDTWGGYQELNSNQLDCTLLNNGDFDGTWTLGDGAYGYTGRSTAGTYLRSYSVTFTYNVSYSMKYDETTGERIDDPVAQALDGTTITFWVQYNVTGTIPMSE